MSFFDEKGELTHFLRGVRGNYLSTWCVHWADDSAIEMISHNSIPWSTYVNQSGETEMSQL